MHKIVLYLKNLLLLLLIFIYLMYFKRFGMDTFDLEISYFGLIAILGLLIFLSILDFRQKKQNIVYNLLFIFIEALLILVFIRTLYDSNFICNSVYYKELIVNMDYPVEIFNVAYLLQNVKYFIIMLIMLIIYRKVNK